MKFIRPKNWMEFQHYKDRAPPWIKLHKGLLDDQEFNELDGFSAKVLVLFWLMASECENGCVAYNAPKIAFRMRLATTQVAESLEKLINSGFVVSDGLPDVPAESLASAKKMREAAGWGSRHISDDVKREVWARDNGVCVQCGCSDPIEYDHIIPVSKGGNSESRNVQLLCRTCNRKKRTSVQAEQVATPAEHPKADAKTAYYRGRDTSKEEETETESISANAAPVAVAPSPTLKTSSRLNGSKSNFEAFYAAYPLRVKRRAAEKAYISALKRAPPDVILAGAKRYRDDPKRLAEPKKFTAHPTSWLNADCWLDETEDVPAEDATDRALRKLQEFRENGPKN